MLWILLFIIFCINIIALIMACLSFNNSREDYESKMRELARLARDGKPIITLDSLKLTRPETKIRDDNEFDYELDEDLKERERMNRLRDLHQMLDD